jgi:hypothetical protein
MTPNRSRLADIRAAIRDDASPFRGDDDGMDAIVTEWLNRNTHESPDGPGDPAPPEDFDLLGPDPGVDPFEPSVEDSDWWAIQGGGGCRPSDRSPDDRLFDSLESPRDYFVRQINETTARRAEEGGEL